MSETFLILTRNERYMIKKIYNDLHVMYTPFLFQFSAFIQLEFSQQIFLKKTQI